MDQTRTAKEIERFSNKDAEKWLKMRKLWLSREMQHVQIARRYAGLMQQKLKKLPPEGNCWTLSSNARKLIADLKRQHVWAQKRFDERTRKQIRRLL